MNNTLLENIMATGKQPVDDRNYWLGKLAGPLKKNIFIYDYPLPDSYSAREAAVDFLLPPDLSGQILHLCNDSDVKIFVFLLAVLKILVHKHSGDTDIILASPIFKQAKEGKYLNTILLTRDRVDKGNSFKEFLLQVKNTVMAAQKHQNYPIEKLLPVLDIDNDRTLFSLVEIVVILENIQEKKYIGDIKRNLFFSFRQEQQKIAGHIYYNELVYKKATIRLLIRHFIHLLRCIFNEMEAPIGETDLLSPQEKKKVSVIFNQTTEVFSGEKVVHYLFEERVEKSKNEPALYDRGIYFTYDELNRKANQIARSLRREGVTPDCPVGVLAERSIDLIAAIMGILKAGGAYLPLDARYPRERLNYILEDSLTKIVLLQSPLQDMISLPVKKIFLDDPVLFEREKTGNLKRVNTGSDLLYMIATSGSTGKPKCVMFEHRNMVNLINFEFSKTDLPFHKKVLQYASINFDASAQEIFSTFLSGGCLYLIREEERHDIKALLDFIREHDIRLIILPPAVMNYIFSESYLIDRFPSSVQHVICSGEQLVIHENLQNYLSSARFRLHNYYGPSETHVVTTFTIDPETAVDGRVPIGKPVSNTSIYILNPDREFLPIGVLGEIYIGGENVGRGYFNREKLTREKFIENPFSTGDVLFRTGDLGRWLPDGNIEFFGRLDNQVKIRGMRIELGEIEKQLVKHEAVKEAVVLVKKEDAGNLYLCAYLVADSHIPGSKLKDYLTETLPEYMIPSFFIFPDKIPITLNGKVDHRALLAINEKEQLVLGCKAPETEAEKKMVNIWKNILGLENVGVLDNFFELGGQSLKASAMIFEIHKEFQVKILINDIFKNQTIEQLLPVIPNGKKQEYITIEKAPYREYYPLSPAQSRLFILNRLEKSVSSFNIPGAIFLEGELDVAQLEEAFSQLIRRHESLRTSFEIRDGDPVQVIHRDSVFHIGHIKIKKEEADYPELMEKYVQQFVQPYDLSKAPLFRVNLLKLKKNKHLLIYDIHHIISDERTMYILVQEFIRLYNDESLPELTLQYKDYSVWQNKLQRSNLIKPQEDYWLNQFPGPVPILNFPLDYPRTSMKDNTGHTTGVVAGKEITQKINRLVLETKTTLNMVLLAAYYVVLSKYSGQEDIIVGSPIDGRRHYDLQNIIGMFVNLIALRNFPSANKSFLTFLEEVKETLLNAYENQDYQFDRLVNKLGIRREKNRHPLLDAAFTIHNKEHYVEDVEIKMKNISVSPFKFEHSNSKFDIHLIVYEFRDKLEIKVEYPIGLLKPETINRFITKYLAVLQQVIENPGERIGDIRLFQPRIMARMNISEKDKEDFGF